MKKLIKAATAALVALIAAPTMSGAAPTNVQHPEWSRNAVIYEVNTRQYTPEGTFDAFSAHLPRLKELGVDILWFMPIHPISELNRKGTLGSYYAVRDYKAVNPEFGDLESFKKVVDEAHKLGMKVIIDWVPNHTGCDNAWVAEHPDWYKRNEAGEMYGPYDWTDVFQLDYSNPEMRKGMIDALSYWLKEADIDGFRCDVAGLVPVDFWDEARPALETVKGKGNIFMLAEATEPELMNNAFDMDYNWPMKDLQNAIADTRGAYTFVRPGEKEKATLDRKDASDIVEMVADQRAKYPAGSYMMNMVTNHDLNSWEGTEYERYGHFLPAMITLTYMLPGMPLIYTGMEVQLDRALEFFEKDQVTEFKSLAQPGSRGSRMTAMLTRLNEIKHKYPQLAAGLDNTTFAEVVDPDNQLVILRGCDKCGETIIGVFNFGSEPMPLASYYNASEGSEVLAVCGQEGLLPANTDTLLSGQAAIILQK